MKILIGTTNPSKVRRFEEMLQNSDIQFYTLKDLQIDQEPDEKGADPRENAIIKAKFYGQFFERVICNDSGLYFDKLPLDDRRQPGLNIRTPGGSERLGDEEMIAYYSKLVHSLGGKCEAFYLDGVAVYNQGTVSSYMEDGQASRQASFYMIDRPSDKRHDGWPLDSLSLNKNTGTYFVEEGNNKYDAVNENIILGEYRGRLIDFLKSSLGIK